MTKARAARFLLAAIVLIVAGLILYFMAFRPKAPRAGRVVRDPGSNVLLITLDTTRPDRLGVYGRAGAVTPEIDDLARAGALFENAYSPVPMTLPAHASILTGTTPLYHGLHLNGRQVLGPEAVTLAEILKGAGLATAAFVSSFVLDSRFGLAQGFDEFSDRLGAPGQVKNLDSERRAPDVFADFKAWLLRRPPGRFFAWVHFYDPHYPYDPPEPFKSDPRLSDPYDGEVAVVDHYVGEIKRLLEAQGLAGTTLIILAGDHGEAFGEHGETDGHTIFGYEENIRVPLILWSAAGIPGAVRVPSRAGLIDIVPTVLDYLKIERPDFVQGRSLLPLVDGRRAPERDLYFESDYFNDIFGCASVRGVLSGPLKYIELPRPEFFDLAADPSEKNNLAADSRRAKDLADYRERLATLEKSQAGGGWASGQTLSEEARRRLESLGYLSGGRRPAAGAGPACDPKDRIGFWNRSLEARKLARDGRLDEAEALLRSLFEEDPRFAPAVDDLASLLFSRQRPADLLRLADRAVSLNPDSAGLRILFGGYLVRLGRAAEALDLLRAAEPLASPEEQEMLYFTMGSALGRLEKLDEAAALFRRVLELEPENFEAARLLGYSLMRLGRFEEAIQAFGTAEAGLPDDPRLLEDTAMSYAELKDFGSAVRYFARAVAVRPTAVLYANYALARAETGDTAQASELMRTAIGRPDAAPELRALGQRYLLEWAAVR